ncbi:hypothetical protein CBG25_02330 [Arsenophonus sp. ENCA]|uniref:hypothetical protein n=1 Tax=Arsenophonus sp. ENCA TaxID=1987579 RepID=UPI000BDA1451|nr:hypothetical protein [Arsenophonus sp. ENCA]PAV10362.1 hypothetical protein CBG25_02330 [Arsenophonus sp. ENCA]
MNISIDNLPNDINLLKQIIVDFQRENLHWQEKYQILLEELNLCRRKRFGRSAEPLSPQGEVFNEHEFRSL